MPESSQQPTANDQWTAARSLLDHYQGVLNQRFAWLTALEGFSLTAFALAVNAAANAKNERLANLLWLGVIVICLVGGVLPWLFVPALRQYGQRLQDVRKYWEELKHEGFPPLRPEPPARGWIRLETLPMLATAAWTMALLFAIVALSIQSSHAGLLKSRAANSPTESFTEDFRPRLTRLVG
jgi:hypothetical protein